MVSASFLLPSTTRRMMLQHSIRRRAPILSLPLPRMGGAAFTNRFSRTNLHYSASCFYSSSSSTPRQSSNNPNNRVPITLYRQLLAWCRRYNDVPFDRPLPPLTISPPQVNFVALKRLREMRAFLSANGINDSLHDDAAGHDCDDVFKRGVNRKVRHPAYYAMYNDTIHVNENMITFPEIADVSELRAIVRSVYWLNNRNTTAIKGEVLASTDVNHDHNIEDETKDQISLAFEAMKSCNLLSSNELDGRRSKRELGIRVRSSVSTPEKEFPDVTYHVGQVVQHRMKKWRGVIVGWTIQEYKADDGRFTSLTTKQYSLEADVASSVADNNLSDNSVSTSQVQYTVLVDLNDASLLRCSSSVSLESQDDLAPVDNPFLQRVKNNLIKQYFAKFAGGHFEPNNKLAYMYPLDQFSICSRALPGLNIVKETRRVESRETPELMKSNMAIARGMQEISNRLLLPLSEASCQPHEDVNGAPTLLTSLKSYILSMPTRDVAPSQNSEGAIPLLAKLYHFHVKINAMLATRKSNQVHKEHIHYSLGQIVRHKLYGFRGVIVAWDPKPRMDVSNWDGLAGIERPQEKPFYHVYPDVNDCISVFGGPRHFRYVCQENLELSPVEETPLDVEVHLDPEEWKWLSDEGRYLPSSEMQFMYAEDLGDRETHIVSSVRSLRKTLTGCMLDIRNGTNANLFSMDDLFFLLRVGAQNLDDATVVEDFIKELWKESPNKYLRSVLDTGIADILTSNHESALAKFNEIIASDPCYGQAWNEKTTVLYLMGQKEEAIASAEQALKIEWRNFQAHAAIGLIEMDASHYDGAIESFRMCLSLNPWLGNISSLLSLCTTKVGNSVTADKFVNK